MLSIACLLLALFVVPYNVQKSTKPAEKGVGWHQKCQIRGELGQKCLERISSVVIPLPPRRPSSLGSGTFRKPEKKRNPWSLYYAYA